MRPRTLAATTLALLACSACDVEGANDPVFREVMVGGGTVFNTNQIEQVAFSELAQPMGRPHQGIKLMKVEVIGKNNVPIGIHDFRLDDGAIVAVNYYGHEYRGAKLLGSRWLLADEQTFRATMRITLAGLDSDDGTPHYKFQHKAGNLWIDNCAPETVNGMFKPGFVRVLSGFTLDENSGELTAANHMTFLACSSGAVGKAAKWGYYDLGAQLFSASLVGPADTINPLDPIDPVGPLEASVIDEPLEPAIDIKQIEFEPFEPFELAIRVVRADYCYDGYSWTKPGVPLLIEDVWDVRAPDPGRTIEAVWGENGLICAGTGRYAADIHSLCAPSVPACGGPSSSLSDYPGGLIMTRIPWSITDDEMK